MSRASSPAPTRMKQSVLLRLLCVAIVLGLTFQPVFAQESLRTLDSHCPFTPAESLDAWQKRADDVRLQLRVALGLLPYPQLDPVQPRIYGKREMRGYSVEKCTFESLPGLIVTGTLYRPATVAEGQKIPAVLCPHGHWTDARFFATNDVSQLLASGAERFENAAANHYQARCVQLARMGCVVYQYDMLGNADSQQITLARAHQFAKQSTEDERNDQGWLLYSPLAESHAQSVMGLQTLATQRAIDMLLSLPEVDANRIAITGASGGGTQTFIAAVIDPRISLAFPAVMVSTGMQGGCTCENCSLLRTGTGNVEMAALFAPKPLGLTAADDWTRTMPEDGFPQLQQLYALYGKKENVALFPSLHFGHNYNHVSRVSMYGWINDHFSLGLKKPVLESDFELLKKDDLTVWNAEHPTPPGGEVFERQLLKLWADILDSQLTGLKNGDAKQNQELAQILRDGWRVVLGLTTGTALETQPALLEKVADGADGDDAAKAAIRLSISGGPVYRYQPTITEQPLVRTDRLAASYTYGYNLSQFSRRSQQLALALLGLADQHSDATIQIHADGANAALTAAAVFCAEEMARESQRTNLAFELTLSGDEFRFANAPSIRDPNFLPGSARFWDFPGLVSTLKAPVQWKKIADNLPQNADSSTN